MTESALCFLARTKVGTVRTIISLYLPFLFFAIDSSPILAARRGGTCQLPGNYCAVTTYLGSAVTRAVGNN